MKKTEQNKQKSYEILIVFEQEEERNTSPTPSTILTLVSTRLSVNSLKIKSKFN